MKQIFLLFAIFFCHAFGTEDTYLYSCFGTLTCSICPDGTTRAFVTCSLGGSYSSSVTCHISVDGEVLTCQAKAGEVIVQQSTKSCQRCPHEPGGGTGGGAGGGGCDVTTPFWWLFCDPFAV